MRQRRLPGAIARARAWFAAGFAEHPTSGEDSPSYRWSLLWFRWGLTAAYIAISLLLRPGQPLGWVVAIIGYLVVYHLVGHTIHTVVHARRGRPVLWFWEAIPFADIAAVSLIVASVPSAIFPVWAAYLLVIFGASVSRRGAYVLTLTAACVVGYAAVVASHLPAGRPVSWSDAVVVGVLLAFGGWFSSNRAQLERSLFAELRQREEKSRALIDAVPDSIIRVRRDGTILDFISKRATSDVRVISADPIGRNIAEFLPREAAERVKRHLELALDSGHPQTFEFEVSRDGRPYYREARIVVSGEDEVTAIVRDTTERKRAEEALRESEERYRTVVENTSDIITVLALNGTMLYNSPSVEPLLGYKAGELAGKRVTEIIHPEDVPEAIEALRPTPQEGGVGQLREFRLRHKDGSWRTIEARGTSRMEGSKIVGYVVVSRDISQRKRAEEALRESEERFRKVFEEGPIGMALVGPDFRIIKVNQALCHMLGYSEQELSSLTFTEITHPEDIEIDVQQARRLFSGEIPSYQMEKRYLTKSKEVVWSNLTASLIRDHEGNPLHGLGIVEDITDRKQAEETVRHLAYHDALTGLPNRELFKDRLTLALAQARRKRQMRAVMFLDLDRFKVVNDTVGHAEGDNLLRSVGERLSSLVREADTVARVGGDEFTILLSEISRAEDAAEVAERILEGLRRPWAVAGHEFHTTTSIGIALYPNDGADAETLLRNADTAMYRAKDQGRDNYQLYAPTMNARIAERLALETGLRHALERQQFVVYYQPQVEIATGQIVGAEALVRWQHPDRGLVFPLEFIPVAEETGLIVSLDEWVLRTACAQNRAWQKSGLPPIRVTVNLSARQFQQRDLIERVAKALKETDLEGHYLQLEITEGVAMQDAGFTIAMLGNLREMGAQISIDDFGTGHSSLSYLKRFPINAIKVDRSFVGDITVDTDDAAIVTTVIAMAHNLGLTVIAEGVETDQQLAFLRQQRCDEFQGYLFSRPVPAHKLEAMLAQGKRLPAGPPLSSAAAPRRR